MFANRPVQKWISVTLAAGAIVATTVTGTQVAGEGTGGSVVAATAETQGSPSAVRPILRPARPSELADIERSEAQKSRAFSYRPPAGARYTDAEMSAFAASAFH